MLDLLPTRNERGAGRLGSDVQLPASRPIQGHGNENGSAGSKDTNADPPAMRDGRVAELIYTVSIEYDLLPDLACAP